MQLSISADHPESDLSDNFYPHNSNVIEIPLCFIQIQNLVCEHNQLFVVGEY